MTSKASDRANDTLNKMFDKQTSTHIVFQPLKWYQKLYYSIKRFLREKFTL
jgi:hypothetical protein